MAGRNSSQPWSHRAAPLSGVTLQAQEAFPFHDGWNIACFVILLLFGLAVLSLVALAFLYELLDCGCCAKDTPVQQRREEEEEPGLLQATAESVSKQPAEVV
ncbi:small integral membrane protein 18-like [Anguilla anguilla]|uniref:small integral membrane protein 18-like n=1 Tax=Anguilla anguilla TaxID=7936 RepID=UPI0015AD3B8C|nr:small integral membrane protein 18-like [Anguilla anguilla]